MLNSNFVISGSLRCASEPGRRPRRRRQEQGRQGIGHERAHRPVGDFSGGSATTHHLDDNSNTNFSHPSHFFFMSGKEDDLFGFIKVRKLYSTVFKEKSEIQKSIICSHAIFSGRIGVFSKKKRIFFAELVVLFADLDDTKTGPGKMPESHYS